MRYLPFFFILLLIPIFTTVLYQAHAGDVTAWVEDSDGDIGPNEYRQVDPKGSVTRRPCPYTCVMRNIPKESCKEWKSITKAQDGECYVQDLRISKDDVMPEDTRKEVEKTTDSYRH